MAKSSFFKVFFADQCTTQLRIPPAFQQHFEYETRKKFYLKGPSGSRWQVGLVKDSDGFFFEDGWKQFVVDLSLTTGDFLVFQYDGNLVFSVMVYDISACEKKAALSARPSKGEIVDVEEVVVKEEVVEEEDIEVKPFVSNAVLKHSSSKKKKRKPQCDSDLSGLTYSYSKRGRPEQNSGINAEQVSLLVQKARSDFLNKEGSPSALRCCISSSKKAREAWGWLRTNSMSLERGDTVKVMRMGSLVSQRRPITEDEVSNALQRAMTFKSTNPFAVVVMQDAYVYSSFFMALPSWFATKHLPKENTEMTVWDPNNKSWKITYISYTKRGALSGGWGKFSYGNNLEKYDVCVFELIEPTQLRIHIFRVVEETAPLLRVRS